MSLDRITDSVTRILAFVFGLVGAFIGMSVGFPLLAKFWPNAEQGLSDLINMWTNSTLPYVADVGKPLLELTPLFIAIVIPFGIIAIIVMLTRRQD